MSRGYCAYCRKALEDEQAILYEYTCYNIGEDNWKKSKETYDGSITIIKDAFVEPIIHQKIKKTPNGRKKLIVKRIHNEVNFSELLTAGKITIENCSSTWKTVDGVDFLTLRLIWRIFYEYQDTSVIPEKMSCCY